MKNKIGLILFIFCEIVNAQTWNNVGYPSGPANINFINCSIVDSVNDVLYVGGSFIAMASGNSTVGDVSANNIAKWNGTSWSALGAGKSSQVSALAVYKGKLYAGGQQFLSEWSTGWTELGTGLSASALVSALVVYKGELYAGGKFTTIGGISAKNIAKWDGSNWSDVGGGTDGPIRGFYVYNNELYVGGEFGAAGSTPAGKIAKWDGSNWSALGTGIDGTVKTFTAYQGTLYVGGCFQKAGNTTVNNLAKWDGVNWFDVGKGVDVCVEALQAYDGELYVGGYFTKVAGQYNHFYLNKWNKTVWSDVGSGCNDFTSIYGFVSALTIYKKGLYVGGKFNPKGTPMIGFALWSSSSEREITAFNFNGLTPAVTGTITDTNIVLTVPYGTNLHSLVATYSASIGATVKIGTTPQVSGTTPNDFTSPLYYTVTAQNGFTRTYKVTVYIKWKWFPQNSGVTNTLRSVHFIDTQNGWTVGSGGTILHTANGGATWLPQNSGVTKYLFSVRFTSLLDGWAAGEDQTILHTTDGGATWSATSGTAGLYYKSIFFVNAKEGWIGGSLGKVLHTTDGGITWINQTTGFTTQIASMYFINTNQGWAVGDDASDVAIGTGDGGLNWGKINIPITCPLQSVFFIDPQHAWIAGKFDWATIDGGQSIYGINATAGKSNWMQSIQFINQNEGYCVGDSGLITSSIDGGISWSVLNSGTLNPLYSVFIDQSNNAWTVGANGTILKNSDVTLQGIKTLSEHTSITIFPNPSTGIFNLNLKEFENVKIYNVTVYNIYGEQVFQSANQHIGTLSNQQIDLSSQPSGIYFLQVKTPGNDIVKKIIKE